MCLPRSAVRTEGGCWVFSAAQVLKARPAGAGPGGRCHLGSGPCKIPEYSSALALFDCTESGMRVIVGKMRSKTKLYIVSNGVVWAQWVGQGVLPDFQPWVSVLPQGGFSLSLHFSLQISFDFSMKREINGLGRAHRAFPPAPQAAQSADQVSDWIRRPKPQPHHGVQKLPGLIQAFLSHRNMKMNVKAHFQVHVKHKHTCYATGFSHEGARQAFVCVESSFICLLALKTP